MSTKLRWGFLSTANIGRKNWKAVHHSGNGNVVAVASRGVERAEKFIAECQAVAPMDAPPRAIGSYEELLAAKDVDAIYMPLPTGLRKEWVLRAAAAGKHVLCEKPCAIRPEELREMIEACRQHRVQFMDGVMFMHNGRLPRMREVLNDDTSVGELRRITTSFNFCGDAEFFRGNIRARSELEPYGCLGDLGWYCIRLALWTMKWEMPRVVTGRAINEISAPGSAPVPTEFSGELFFDGGVSCAFYCSFVSALEQQATITGTKGYLRVNDFVVPYHASEVTFEVNNALRSSNHDLGAQWTKFSVPEHSNSHPTAQEANMFRAFANLARSGTPDDFWPDIALKTQQVMHACFESAKRSSQPLAPV